MARSISSSEVAQQRRSLPALQAQVFRLRLVLAVREVVVTLEAKARAEAEPHDRRDQAMSALIQAMMASPIHLTSALQLASSHEMYSNQRKRSSRSMIPGERLSSLRSRHSPVALKSRSDPRRLRGWSCSDRTPADPRATVRHRKCKTFGFRREMSDCIWDNASLGLAWLVNEPEKVSW